MFADLCTSGDYRCYRPYNSHIILWNFHYRTYLKEVPLLANKGSAEHPWFCGNGDENCTFNSDNCFLANNNLTLMLKKICFVFKDSLFHFIKTTNPAQAIYLFCPIYSLSKLFTLMELVIDQLQ